MKKGTAITFSVGVLTGLALCGPAVQAAADVLTASPTSQTFYVNGQRAEFEAYSIHGNNFVKLRDIGKAADFSVTYDGATNSVHINPDAPYTEEAATPAQTTASPVLTEESVRATIRALRDIYPTNTPYGAPYRSTSHGPYSGGINCAGWATLCSDAAFGDLPWRRVDRPGWAQIRAGDLVEYNDGTNHHVVVVLEKTDEYIKVTESGRNNKARWGGQYFKWWLEGQPSYILYTRYPD